MSLDSYLIAKEFPQNTIHGNEVRILLRTGIKEQVDEDQKS